MVVTGKVEEGERVASTKVAEEAAAELRGRNVDLYNVAIPLACAAFIVGVVVTKIYLATGCQELPVEPTTMLAESVTYEAESADSPCYSPEQETTLAVMLFTLGYYIFVGGDND